MNTAFMIGYRVGPIMGAFVDKIGTRSGYVIPFFIASIAYFIAPGVMHILLPINFKFVIVHEKP